MMKCLARGTVILLVASLALQGGPVLAADYTTQLTELAKGKIKEFAENPVVVAAVVAQNAQTAAYDQAKIDSMDKQWMAEVDAADKPLITATMGTDAAKFLKKVQDDSQGLYTEIFATDDKGLNVAQSSVTSDYWQGDEDKFSKTFSVGPDAVFLGKVEQDESTQQFQQQVSITIDDPATGKPIGSITVGVNLADL
ncbi:MAG: hypothetical protein P4M09_30245 [Devosia sp.]|nr:hypothetical protein [Devosia sp.]